MAAFVYGIRVLFRKELRMILKDPRSRFILVMPVIVQTLLFGYVATYDLNKVLYALLDEDRSAASRELAAKFDGSGIFQRVATLRNSADMAEQLDGKKALVVVHIGPHFERRLALGEQVPVQALVDGRNGNVAGIAASYVSDILGAFNAERLQKRGIAIATPAPVTRAWFNPNMVTRWNIISGMLAVLSLIQVMILTALSVAREKEQGTFDQLLVTPLEPMAVMLGKALPSVVVGLAQSALVFCIAIFWFAIPFGGSGLLLFSGLALFNFAVVGMGLCISALTATMQQAMLYAFSFMMPMILLSGFATPISSMPAAVRYITFVNPARYGIDFVQRVYLQGANLADVAHTLWPLAVITLVTMGVAARLFRSRLG